MFLYSTLNLIPYTPLFASSFILKLKLAVFVASLLKFFFDSYTTGLSYTRGTSSKLGVILMSHAVY